MSPESRSPGTNGSNLEEVCTGYASDRAAVIALRASRRRRADGNVKRNDAVLVVVRGGKTVREPGQAARRSVVSTHAQRQSPLQNRHRTCTNVPKYVPLWGPRADVYLGCAHVFAGANGHVATPRSAVALREVSFNKTASPSRARAKAVCGG